MFYYDHQDLSVQEAITQKISEFYFNKNLSRNNFANVTNVICYEFDFVQKVMRKIYLFDSYSLTDGFLVLWTHIYG